MTTPTVRDWFAVFSGDGSLAALAAFCDWLEERGEDAGAIRLLPDLWREVDFTFRHSAQTPGYTHVCFDRRAGGDGAFFLRQDPREPGALTTPSVFHPAVNALFTASCGPDPTLRPARNWFEAHSGCRFVCWRSEPGRCKFRLPKRRP